MMFEVIRKLSHRGVLEIHPSYLKEPTYKAIIEQIDIVIKECDIK